MLDSAIHCQSKLDDSGPARHGIRAFVHLLYPFLPDSSIVDSQLLSYLVSISWLHWLIQWRRTRSSILMFYEPYSLPAWTGCTKQVLQDTRLANQIKSNKRPSYPCQGPFCDLSRKHDHQWLQHDEPESQSESQLQSGLIWTTTIPKFHLQQYRIQEWKKKQTCRSIPPCVHEHGIGRSPDQFLNRSGGGDRFGRSDGPSTGIQCHSRASHPVLHPHESFGVFPAMTNQHFSVALRETNQQYCSEQSSHAERMRSQQLLKCHMPWRKAKHSLLL